MIAGKPNRKEQRMRANNRSGQQLRPITFIPGYINNVPGSVLCEQGNTRVVATATIEEKTPHFLKKSGQGWITAEYSMLPGSSGNQRIARERGKINNRSGEIQRFISRALRTVVNLKEIGARTITLDTDVIQADGSTPERNRRQDNHPGHRRDSGRRQHPLRLAQCRFFGHDFGVQISGLRAIDR